MWGAVSSSFVHLNNAASWSEFVIPVGFPEDFIESLDDDLTFAFDKNVRLSEVVHMVRDAGWAAICHIQDGITWTQADADRWVPYSGRANRKPGKKPDL